MWDIMKVCCCVFVKINFGNFFINILLWRINKLRLFKLDEYLVLDCVCILFFVLWVFW